MKTTRNHTIWICSTLVALSASLYAQTETAKAEFSSAERIARANVFPRPLVWVGDAAPSEAESAGLESTLAAFGSQKARGGIEALEQYVAAHPRSAWAPSIHLHLGEFARNQGRYSLALTHWQAAWVGSMGSIDTAGQELAVNAAANLACLLGNLGEKQKLEALLNELDERKLSLRWHGTSVEGARARLRSMKVRPGDAFRCGLFALNQYAKVTQQDAQLKRRLLQIMAPDDGFSVDQLLALAQTNGIALAAVRRPAAAELVLPCVAHWKVNHYATILSRNGSKFQVADPTFGNPLWIEGDVLEAELSGVFLVPANKAPSGWTVLDAAECKSVVGRGYPNGFSDPEDTPPDDCGEGDGQDSQCDPPSPNDCADLATLQAAGCCGGSGDNPGGDGNQATLWGNESSNGNDNSSFTLWGGVGMPKWRVSEPYVTAWLEDTPLRYQLSSGKWMPLSLSYKQRGEDLGSSIGGFGPKWSCNWLAMLEGNAASMKPSELANHRAGGGVLISDWEMRTPQYKSGSVCGFGSCFGIPAAPVIKSPTGAENWYSYIRGFGGGVTNYFLTHRMDRYGRATIFNYELVSGVVRVKSVVDVDGRTNTLSYTNTAFPNRITAVTNVYGQAARFTYDGQGRLTNIVDMAGMASSFQYDASDNITNMITPYGTTRFESFEGVNTAYQSESRALRVTEPSGDQQLYVYRDYGPAGVAGDGLPYYRNSYHWNRAQYVAISNQGKTNFIEMPDADFQLASTKHWLHGPDSQNLTVSDTLDALGGPVDPKVGGRSDVVTFRYQGQTTANFVGTLQRATEVWRSDGKALEISRNEVGRATVITYYSRSDRSVSGSYTNYYDSSGRRLLRQMGPRGELVHGYGYHPVITNLLVSVTNALGEVTRYTHDTNTMKVTSITFPGGLARTNLYYDDGPSKGFLRAQIDIGVRTNSFGYLNGDIVSHTNALGLVVADFWDDLHRWVGQSFPDGTTVSNVYSKLDVVARKDRLGAWSYYGYNLVRQLTATTNANNQVTRYEYCGCGGPSLVIRSNGSSALFTQFAYDTGGRLTNTIYADGYQVSRAYDYLGLLTELRDSGGRRLTISYEPRGLRYGVSEALLEDHTIFAQGFDEYGRSTNSVNQNGAALAQTFDLLGRVVTRQTIGSSQQAKGGIEQFAYDARGLTNYIDISGGLTTFVRDAAGRTLFETNANTEVLGYTYNPVDALLTLADGKRQTTTWRYNEYGLVTNKLDANGAEMFRYRYDAEGRLTNRWTPEKGNTYYTYDPLGNLKSVRYPGLTNTFAYDALNRLTNATDALGTTAFTWTDGNDLASENGPWAADTVSFAYSHRQRSSLSVQRPNAATWTQSYTYDSYGRLNHITSGTGTFDYYYTGFDLVNNIHLPSNSDDGRTYDDLGRLTSIGIGNVDRYEYGYNAASQRTQQVFSAWNFVNYTYDKIGQLKSARGWEQDGVTARLHEQFGYGYDAAWNLSSRTNNGLVQTFAVNNLNQLSGAGRSGTLTVAGTVGQGTAPISVTVSGTGLTSGAATLYADGAWARAGATPANGQNTYTATATDNASRTSQASVTLNLPSSVTYQYDGNGNLTSDGLRSFEYDWENQLTNVYVAGQWRSEFVYDALMRRRVRKEFTWSGGAWVKTNEVRYVYDGRVGLQERDANNLPLTTYTRGLDLSGRLQDAGGIGGLLARTDHSTVDGQGAHAYYHCDANGNVTCLVNRDNVAVARYDYDPFGNVQSMSGPLAEINLYRFSSKEWHRNSGLVYYMYRYYEPGLQRWINRDPLGEVGFETLAPPRFSTQDVDGGSYTYVLNDPLTRIDPLGLQYGAGNGDSDPAVDACKGRCHDWADALAKQGGFDSSRALRNCFEGCDRDPNYRPGTPLPPLPVLRPTPKEPLWPLVRSCAKAGWDWWKNRPKKKK